MTREPHSLASLTGAVWEALETHYGADPAACKTALIEAADCANVADQDDLCPAGEEYTPTKAKKGKSATESQDCADFLAGTEADAACSEVCAAP